MNTKDVKYEVLCGGGYAELLHAEIDGASTFVASATKNSPYKASLSADESRVVILYEGSASLRGKTYDGITVFAFAPCESFVFESDAASFFEVRWRLLDGESVDASKFPYALRYADAVKYREDCKSEKTVSRMLLDEGIIPRLAIGSVETHGLDRIEKHTHPYCDQLFYTLPECNMELVVDDFSVHFDGNTLLHIPLASSHGVDVTECGCAHYIWLDFVIDPRGVEYLHSAHEKIE